MDHGAANPIANTTLRAMEDRVHLARRLWGGLNAVQALTSITETVPHVIGKQVRFSKMPELKHVW